jgi:hypothetical protein
MKVKIAKTYFLIPLIYIGIIGYLLLQYLSFSEGFGESVGRIQLSGSAAAGANGTSKGVRELNIRALGLNIHISDKTPLMDIRVLRILLKYPLKKI